MAFLTSNFWLLPQKSNVATQLSCPRGTPRPMKIEFARQPIILQMASKKNGDTTDAWRSQAVSATSTQWWENGSPSPRSGGQTEACATLEDAIVALKAEIARLCSRVVGGVSRCGRFPLSRAIHAHVPPRRGLCRGAGLVAVPICNTALMVLPASMSATASLIAACG